jgi:hypothetical protein
VAHRQDQVVALGQVVAGLAVPGRPVAAAEVAGQLERAARLGAAVVATGGEVLALTEIRQQLYSTIPRMVDLVQLGARPHHMHDIYTSFLANRHLNMAP